MVVVKSFLKILSTSMLVLFGMLSTGCRSQNASFEYLFEDAISIEGEHLEEKYLTPFSFKCFYSSDSFLGTMTLPNKQIIHKVDLHSGKVLFSAVSKGRGPGEILTSLPHIDYVDGSLYVGDIATNRIKRITSDGDSLLVEDFTTIKYNVPTIMAEMKVVSDTLFAIFGYGRTSHNILMANKSGVVTDSIPYTILDDTKIDHSKVGPFYVSMAISPDRNYLFICNKTYNHIRKYQIEKNAINYISQYNLTDPKYKIKSGKPIQTGDNMTFWGELFLGDKYIYLVANPEYRKDFELRKNIATREGNTVTALPDKDSYILVFDYDFNYVRSYLCDGHFSWITLTNNPTIIYAANEREHCLTKYTLTGLE